ncbi:MAG TPA: phosphatase PAP2 family protein [Pyrinomonadaceae bacterium]|jgi:membrane-associated phospholipid phosphatase|nr:phosphatase PAP2 family protein [Pyrinomonadaceae bacterium]
MRRNGSVLCLFGVATLGLILSTVPAVRGQIVPNPSPTPVATPTPSLERQFFKNILNDQKAIWTAPFRLHKEEAKWMIPSGIGLMAFITTDRISGDEIAEFDRLSTAAHVLSYPGSAYGVTAAAASFYLFGREKHNERARETGILIAEGAIDSVVVFSALKVATQRSRPDTGRERSEFFDGGSSFPSGHSTQAWTMATIVANEYHDKRAVQIAAYSIASAVSFARFTGGSHYISDVLVGSALGYGIGKYVYKAHHRKDSQSGDDDSEARRLSIAPAFNRSARRYGIDLTWRF